jgi:imidazolonepropionase-like amidohydrolase
VVEGRRIHAVGPATAVVASSGTELVELPDATVLPGLIDTHVHLSAFNTTTFQNYRAAKLEVPPELQMLHALVHAQLCLERGFTTLRHLGWVTYRGQDTRAMVALRDAIDAGLLPGPRLIVAGLAIITCAHLDLLLPRTVPRRRGVTADGPWSLRRLVRQQLRLGADLIKTSASGGGGTDREDFDVRNMTQVELDAVVDEAHAFHRRCACHCVTAEAQRMAVRAGVDTLEHIVFTDDEALAMIRAEERIVVPTLSIRTNAAIEARRRLGAPADDLERMRLFQRHAETSFKRVHQAGITLAMGTDTALEPAMGENAGELALYVRYGMTPAEAIQTATRNAAAALGLERALGTVEPGKLADLVAVRGNPLQDITILQDPEAILLVMKDGVTQVDRRPGRERHVVPPGARPWVIRV